MPSWLDATYAAATMLVWMVAAIVGAAGLPSTLAAARAGKRILPANKEWLVLAREMLMQAPHAPRSSHPYDR